MRLICIRDSHKNIFAVGITDGLTYYEVDVLTDREDCYFIVNDNGHTGYYSKFLFITEVEFRKQNLELLLSLL